VSVQVPIRLKIEQGGVVKGYVEALNFTGGTAVTVNGPIADVAGGGGGGDAATLEGHPASFFATAADVAAIEAELARDSVFELLGIAVSASAPTDGITYAQWLSGSAGHWGWILLP
jgi:pyruvate/2-oxoglutarate dehydrogenase complex dihydrolipoamide acyltransferase (E2) component